ncbi:coiled-coil domain-containing protein 169-like isoform X40 [Ruditapes philippinarum]|uniref:coiled-coil domain-containing protein 169-like isoform X40 n=1 Tax=Ruditapes philippinarum TaxID=129788 RepID=UPI00295BAA34|nr:coiled-coil domain-containing protein 169-like isoform X40 [Ruditapes philippinarum]
MADEVDEYELEKLRAEIQQERQMKEMLDQSARELRITVEELEKRYEAIESEDPDLTARGNEWKTRFETQEEMNQQLERQIIMLQDKIEEAKRNLKDGTYYAENLKTMLYLSGKTPRDMKSFDDLSDANPAMVKNMEKEKNLLYNQLRDLEWRLDQESKAYHKANDERKQYVVEINSTKGNIDGNKARQRAAVNLQQREVEEMSRSPRLLGYTERFKLRQHHRSPDKEQKDQKLTPRLANHVASRVSQTSRISNDYSNIPEDQRIIDPKRGPIKKTAAVKNLPSLETT